MNSLQRHRKGRAPATAIAGRGPLAQRKIEIGTADDAFEREADQVARKVGAGQASAWPAGRWVSQRRSRSGRSGRGKPTTTSMRRRKAVSMCSAALVVTTTMPR